MITSLFFWKKDYAATALPPLSFESGVGGPTGDGFGRGFGEGFTGLDGVTGMSGVGVGSGGFTGGTTGTFGEGFGSGYTFGYPLIEWELSLDSGINGYTWLLVGAY